MNTVDICCLELNGHHDSQEGSLSSFSTLSFLSYLSSLSSRSYLSLLNSVNSRCASTTNTFALLCIQKVLLLFLLFYLYTLGRQTFHCQIGGQIGTFSQVQDKGPDLCWVWLWGGAPGALCKQLASDFNEYASQITCTDICRWAWRPLQPPFNTNPYHFIFPRASSFSFFFFALFSLFWMASLAGCETKVRKVWWMEVISHRLTAISLPTHPSVAVAYLLLFSFFFLPMPSSPRRAALMCVFSP